MSLIASHHDLDLDVLEQLSVGADSLGAGVVADCQALTGAVVLATCNRFELYLEIDDVAQVDTTVEQVVARIARDSEVPVERVTEVLGLAVDEEAARHLFGVACGLESMVVGEREISGQVRRALAAARNAGTASPTLDRLFQAALRSARLVGMRTGLGTSGRSVVSVAFELAHPAMPDWSQARAVLVGTGFCADSSLEALVALGVAEIAVFSPSGRAEAFASNRAVHSIDAAGFAQALVEADVVVACSGGSGKSLTAPMLQSARTGTTRPLVVLDLALHRDVDPVVAQLPGVTLIDLEAVRAEAPGEQPDVLGAASEIVEQEAAEFAVAVEARELDPAVVALRQHVFDILDDEIAKVRAAGDPVAEETERALRRFARRMLHTPTVRAREHVRSGAKDDYLDALQALYGIDARPPVD
ncbi:MAG TPA: glutamyl-tRNA reductase [Cellulomonas sp.]|nr:glutamyl-tRNA reductase [Cellulomonas sp.]